MDPLVPFELASLVCNVNQSNIRITQLTYTMKLQFIENKLIQT